MKKENNFTSFVKASVFLFVLSVFFIMVFWGVSILVRKNILLVDERDSYEQILRFFYGGFSLDPDIASMPGYYAFIAFILKIFRTKSALLLRYLGAVVNLSLLPVFYFAARLVKEKEAFLKTLQFIFLPILFPFFPLIYGDILSVALVILAFYFVMKKKHLLSGLFVFLSLFVKQTNIVWLVFLNLILYFRIYGFNPPSRNSTNLCLRNFKFCRPEIILHLRKSIFYILGGVLFTIFVFINGGVSLGQKEMHPLIVSNLGNVYFGLFVFLVLFWPILIVDGRRKIVDLFRRKRWVLGIFFIWLFVYLLTFSNSHIFNQSPFFLRNRLLVFVTSGLLLKTAFFVTSFLSLLLVLPVRFHQKRWAFLLYPFTFISLLPMSLIEQRYYLIPIAFFMLFRKQEKPFWEWLLLVYFLFMSIVLFSGIYLRGDYFL